MDRQKPYFHVSSLKEYRENDPDRFASRRMDKLAPILINNAKKWEVEDILDYRLQNNHYEFLVHCKGYERANDFWEPYDNEEYDSSSSEVEYFPIYNDGLLGQQENEEVSEEN